MLTDLQVRDRLKREILKAGSLRNLAKRWSVSPAYVSDVMLGRRNPGPAILKPLGLKRRIRRDYFSVGEHDG